MTNRMVGFWRQAAFVGLLTLFSVGICFGQAITGSITGTVHDSSGAAITSANITLTETLTGVQRKSVTNDRGDFVFNSVPPGAYTVRIEANGFKAVQIPDINLTASEQLPLPPTSLEVGATHDTVTVAADAAVVQTQSGERSSNLNSAQLDKLMDNGRTALSIITLLPGVVTTSAGGSPSPSNWANRFSRVAIYSSTLIAHGGNCRRMGVKLNARLGSQYGSIRAKRRSRQVYRATQTQKRF